MAIDWDVPITMDDGAVLRADVYRPLGEGRYPMLMTHGPYAKGLPFQTGYAFAWNALERDHPEALADSSNKYQAWETPDPEIWTREYGYVCIRVDSRGAGRSPGRIDVLSPRETQDFHDCIEWAGTQSWSNGKVGLTGISYYAMNQWQVAATRPKHLAAICPFEGAADFYRDAVRHGGILCTFWIRWYPVQVSAVQNGLGERGKSNPNTGELIAGPQTEPPEALAARIADLPAEQRAHTLDDDYFRQRTPALENIEVPVLSRGNWGGLGLHLRGNTEGYQRAGSRQKWLEMHGYEHWTEYYTREGRAMMRKFFDHFLKGEDNGWEKTAPVQLNVRHPDRFIKREEQEWPLARTQWTRHYLDASGKTLREVPPGPASAHYRGFSPGITFWTEPQKTELELTGPVAAKLFVSSSTADADLFLTLRAFGPHGREALFTGASDPNNPVAYGWLRASHRKLDAGKSLPYRPYHAHDEAQPLTPGEIYELDIEIWPTSIVLPRGWRLALTVAGQDFDHGLPGPMPRTYGGIEMRGCSLHLHDDPQDRPAEVFDGTITIHSGEDHPLHLLLPVIPA
ncbi:CocE/NonD family hydrolase [Pusillimonas noertemannii]|nr:CocE/NonD family hydrolase [Pusillimonas noertemannii]NYT67089.1 CocE/NonD family hydrolase [Pusillimonas noertemannii]